MYKQIRLGFNTRSNTQATGRTSNVVAIGKMRNTLASTTRKFNYCNRNSPSLDATLRCVFEAPPQRPIFNDGQFQVAVGNSIFTISVDYGRTWTSKPEFSSYNLRCVAISNNGQYVLAGGYSPLFYSNDGGKTFVQKLPEPPQQYWFDIKMSKSGQYQTAIGPPGLVYTSTDYGNTFTSINLTISGGSNSFLAMSYDGQYQSITSGFDIYISNDYGKTWTQKDLSIIPTPASSLQGIAMSGNGQLQIAVEGNGNGNIYKSTDYGNTWNYSYTIVTQNNSFYFISMSETGQYQLIPDYGSGGSFGGGGNIWISNDFGNTYTNLINIDGQPQSVFGVRGWYPCAVSASGKYQTVCDYNGSTIQQNGGYIYTSEDYGQNWKVRLSSGAHYWWGMFMS